MRVITINCTDYTAGTFIGYHGENLMTRINIEIPQELVDMTPDHYIVEFLTSNFELIPTSAMQATGDYLIIDTWQQIMVAGAVTAQISAYDDLDINGDTPIGKSAKVNLLVGQSQSGTVVPASTEIGGLIAELKQIKNAAIVDTLADRPENPVDGAEVIVREIDQYTDMRAILSDLYNSADPDKINPSKIGQTMPQIYFKKTPKKPNFTELGIPSQVMISGITNCYGPITPHPRNIHWHYLLSADLYNMSYVPAGFFFPVAVLLFEYIIDAEPIKTNFLYLFDPLEIEDDEGGESTFLTGWLEVTEWDEDDQIANVQPLSEMPPVLSPSSLYFENNANGVACEKYFSTVCSDKPFTYRRYIADGGKWIEL